MSPTKAHDSGPTADSQAGLLHWEVFVTPGIPIVTRDKPPDVRETYFQAMAATLIYGARDAVRMLKLYPNRVNPGWALWSSARAVKWLNPEIVA